MKKEILKVVAIFLIILGILSLFAEVWIIDVLRNQKVLLVPVWMTPVSGMLMVSGIFAAIIQTSELDRKRNIKIFFLSFVSCLILWCILFSYANSLEKEVYVDTVSPYFMLYFYGFYKMFKKNSECTILK
jgi:hypothetical protein